MTSPPFRIVQVTDTHLSRNRAYFQSNWEAFLRLMDEERPDLVIHTGDLAFAGNEDTDDLVFGRLQMDRLSVPWRIIPGNHDIGDTPPDPKRGHAMTEDLRNRWLDLFGPDWWTVDIGGWRLVAVNAQLMGSGFAAEIEQWTWLERVLADARERRVLLFSHKPPFFGDPDDPAFTNSSLRLEPRRRLLRLMATHGVSLLACGHNHVYQMVRSDGVDVLWAPSTSFIHYLPKAGAAADAQRITGYVRFMLADAEARYECVEPDRFLRFDVTPWQRVHGTTSKMPPMPLRTLGGGAA